MFFDKKVVHFGGHSNFTVKNINTVNYNNIMLIALFVIKHNVLKKQYFSAIEINANHIETEKKRYFNFFVFVKLRRVLNG